MRILIVLECVWSFSECSKLYKLSNPNVQKEKKTCLPASEEKVDYPKGKLAMEEAMEFDSDRAIW